MTSSNQQYVTLSLTVKDTDAALDFYTQAFDAKVLNQFTMPDGSLVHADLQIGNTVLFLSGEFPQWGALSPLHYGGCPNLICIKDESCDAVFDRAVAAGATVIEPMTDQFWGERVGILRDPSGYRWSVGKSIETVTPEILLERMNAMMPDEA